MHMVLSRMIRVGQNRIYTPYMTVYLVISLPKIPYIHRIYIYIYIYIYMVLANPTYDWLQHRSSLLLVCHFYIKYLII
jgi:hypothetical protein